jgi:hypothetical protein
VIFSKISLPVRFLQKVEVRNFSVVKKGETLVDENPKERFPSIYGEAGVRGIPGG